MEIEIKNLDNQFLSLKQELGHLEGQYDLLSRQILTSKDNIQKYEEAKQIDLKAVEVLNVVQKQSRDVVKNTFESLVSFALKSVYGEDYLFRLEFGNRGNLGELDFMLKSPENTEYLPIEECTAGGSVDVIALALRFVLLQVLKVPGPVILDEPTKMLSSNYRINEYNLYRYLSEKLERQLIIISHSKEIIELADTKVIIE